MHCLQPAIKHKEGSVTVWGCISAFDAGKLVKINGTLTKEVQADTAAPCCCICSLIII